MESKFDLVITGGAYPTKTILEDITEEKANEFIKNKKCCGKYRGFALRKRYV